MKLTQGNKGPDGVEHNLQLLANLLCEIARFELPYPEVFGVERLRLLESAVGDSSGTSATAVGVASTLDPDALAPIRLPPMVDLRSLSSKRRPLATIGHRDRSSCSNSPSGQRPSSFPRVEHSSTAPLWFSCA